MENIIGEKKSFSALPFIIALAAAVTVMLAAAIFLFIAKSASDAKLAQARKMLASMQEEAERITADKEKIIAEKEKLQADAISYIGINTGLEREKEELDKKVKAALKIINNKEKDLKSASQRLKDAEKKLSRQAGLENGRAGRLEAEMAALAAQVKSLEETLRAERGSYHYNLAVAYTQARLYDEAVEAYKKALEADPKNPDAYYNLGLLYENHKGDPDAAIACYRKYVELRPDAEDRDEVQAWIGRLR